MLEVGGDTGWSQSPQCLQLAAGVVEEQAESLMVRAQVAVKRSECWCSIAQSCDISIALNISR